MHRLLLASALLLTIGASSVACGSLLGIHSDEDEDEPGSNNNTTPDSASGDSNTAITDASGSGDNNAQGDDANLDVVQGSDSPISSPEKIVFLSVATFNTGSRNGPLYRPGADAICQTEANAAGIGSPTRVFVAWMSVSQDASNAIDRLNSGEWHMPPAPNNVSGPLVFPSKAAIQGGPAVPINRHANGIDVDPADDDKVWTGTNVNGLASSLDCLGWTAQSQSSATQGMVGVTDSKWTDLGAAQSCDGQHRVLCFER